MRRILIGAAALLSLLVAGTSSGAEVVVAKVIAVEGKEITVSAGESAGISAGQVFAVDSLDKVMRLSLAAGDDAPESGARAKVLRVEADKAVLEVTSSAEGFGPAAGMVAVAIVGELPMAAEPPAGPQGFALKASKTSAAPGDDIVLTAEGHEPGTSYTWKATGGELAYGGSVAPEAHWSAPRSAAKVTLSCTRRSRDGKTETASVEIECTGAAGPLPEKVAIERALGSRRFDEPISAGHRVGDVAFDDRGVLYILDTKTCKVYTMDAFGASAVIFPREESGAQTMLGPVAVTVTKGRLYVADASARMIKVYSTSPADGGKFLRTIGAGEPMSRIADVASDPSGKVYALDSSRRCLHVFAPDGRYVRNFCRKGAGTGELLRPVAMDCDLDGNVYVLDTGRKDFQVFDTNHVVKGATPVEVKGAGEPVDIAVRPIDGTVFVLYGAPSPAVVAYRDGKAVLSSLEKMAVFAGLPEEPSRIAIDAAGTVVISPRARRRLHRYDAEAKPVGWLSDVAPGIRSLAISRSGSVIGIAGRSPLLRIWNTKWWLQGEHVDTADQEAVATNLSLAAASGDGSALCAVDPGNLTILAFDGEGKLTKTLGGKAEGRDPPAGKLQSITDICPAGGASIAVLDARDSSIVTFNVTDGSATAKKLPSGRKPEQVGSPWRLAIDATTGDLYIFDRRDRRIKRYTDDGNYAGSIGGPGTEPGRFSSVDRMVVGARGELWAFDSGRGDIQRIDLRGPEAKSTFTIGREPFDADIVDISVDSRGRLYVLTARDTVYVFGQQ